MTCEEHSIIGGLGSAVAEVLGENAPVPMKRIGVNDVFGTSGEPDELMVHFRLKAADIAAAAQKLLGLGNIAAGIRTSPAGRASAGGRFALDSFSLVKGLTPTVS